MRRLISFISIAVALVALGLVLYNATLVDRRPPAVAGVSLSAPAGDDRTAQTLTAIDIDFSEAVRTATVEARFRIEPFVAGSFAWDGSTAIFTPSAKLPPDTAFTIRIEPGFEDLNGNVADVGLEPWAFRTIGPPQVVRAQPGDGATGLAVDGQVELEFDRLMDTASVEAAISIDPSAEVEASWNGESVRLAFGGDLRFGTTYTLTVGTAAADTSGNRLRDAFSLHFTTVAAGLRVLETAPASGVSGIGVQTQVAIRFDAPIDADSARSAFRITPSVAGDVLVVAVPDDLGAGDPAAEPRLPDTLVFVPDDPLAPHTTYTVTLGPSVARADNPDIVAAGLRWSFTTGAPTTSGQNQLAFLTARSGVRNVWLMNPDGTNQRQLTTELVPVSGFDVTGDGGLVAYAAGGAVMTLGIDGQDPQRLTADGEFEYAPAFTPDDLWVLVGRRSGDGADLGYWLVPLPGTGGEPRQVLDHGAPPLGSAGLAGEGIVGGDGTPGWVARTAFDPTGRWALLVTAGGEPFLIDLSAEETAEPPRPIPLTVDAAPAWSPRHGAFLVTASAAAGSSVRPGLRSVSPAGAVAEVIGGDGAFGPVTVGPAGAVAASVRSAGADRAGVVLLPPDGGPARTFEPGALTDDRWPSFAPDGLSLLIGRTAVDRPEEGAGIWWLDLVTGQARQLSTDGAYARWLP